MRKTGKNKKCNKSNTTSTLCWTCKNSVPNPDKNLGCSWSECLVPVEGWYAELTNISYFVIDCPEYIPEDKLTKKKK